MSTTQHLPRTAPPRPGRIRAGSTGTAVPGYEARVVDQHLNDVPRGTPGRLAIRGPTGCRYWRKLERQHEYVRNGWTITGHVYRQDDDGYFWYQCRNDDLIICGGYNIAGPDVENVLLGNRKDPVELREREVQRKAPRSPGAAQ